MLDIILCLFFWILILYAVVLIINFIIRIAEEIYDRTPKQKEKTLKEKQIIKQRNEMEARIVKDHNTKFKYLCNHCGAKANDIEQFTICSSCGKDRRHYYATIIRIDNISDYMR